MADARFRRGRLEGLTPERAVESEFLPHIELGEQPREGLGERGTRQLVATSEVIETFQLLGCHSLLRLTDESATDRVEDRQRS